MMADDFQKVQLQLAAHLRNPKNNPPPEGLSDERLSVYRKLFLNNIANLLSNGFPVLYELYGDEKWQDLIRGFYASHQSHTPYFAKVSKEFLDYLRREHIINKDDPPFLNELAHYEWIEMALSNADREIKHEQINQAGNLLDAPPVLSPLAWLLAYQWPVHSISPDYQPSEPGQTPTYIVLCRNSAGEVKFIKVNVTTHILLKSIRKYPTINGSTHIESVFHHLNIPFNQTSIQSGLDILEKMRNKEVILGTAK